MLGIEEDRARVKSKETTVDGLIERVAFDAGIGGSPDEVSTWDVAALF